jgi:hypothetical protein
MKPYHGRPYPILHKHKAVLNKKIKWLWLYDIGVLEWQPSLQWALLTFIIPKKDSIVCTISNFRELNKRIVGKPYPIPKISTILQELEGFTYVTALILHGLLHHQAGPNSVGGVYYHLPLGKVFL